MAEQFTPTVTPQAEGGVGSVKEVGARLNQAKQWDQAFGLLMTAAQTAETLTADDKRRQSQEDMAEASAFASQTAIDVSQMPAEDRAAAYEGIVEGIQSGESTRSDTYNRTLMNSILPKYTSAAIERKTQLADVDIRMSTDTSVLDGVNQGTFGNVSANIQSTASRLNVDVARVRDSFYGSYYGYYKDKISGISDQGALDSVLAEMKLSDKALNSPQLLGNSSTGESGKFLKVQKQQFASALSGAQSAITKRNTLIVKDTENKTDPNPRGRYQQHPSTIKGKYPDSVAYKEAVQLYTEHSSNVEQADNYDTERGTNFNILSDGAQTIVKKDITTSIVNNFDDFDGGTLASTLISQKQNAGNGVSHIKANLYSVNELASADTFLKIQQLRGQPNGEEALNVIFSDEGERSKYDAIVALQESGIVGSMFEANKYMNQPKTKWGLSRKEEQKFNATFDGIPVNIANRGKNTYSALRSRGVSHDVAIKAAEKSVEAKADVGGVTIHGSNQPFDNNEAVKSSIGTQLNAMTAPFGEDIVHSYDMWSNSIVSTNEYGVVINTTNRDELVGLSTTVSAFKRDAQEHRIRIGAERIGDDFNSQVQKFLRLKGKSIVGAGESFIELDTADTLWNKINKSYGPHSIARRRAREEASKSTFMNKKGDSK